MPANEIIRRHMSAQQGFRLLVALVPPGGGHEVEMDVGSALEASILTNDNVETHFFGNTLARRRS